MNVEVLSRIENNVINRTEYCFLISFDSSTPSRSEMRESIKAKVGSDPSLFVIYRVEPLSGRKSVKVNVHVYKDKETMNRVESHYVLKRNGLIQESKKESNSEQQ